MKRLTPLLLLCVLMLSGCLKSISVDEYGFVLSIGIDAGQNKKYAYSFLLQHDEGTSSDSGIEFVNHILLSAEGDTLFDAIATIVAGTPYVLNFTRTNNVAFSEEIAMGDGLVDFMALHLNEHKIRPSIKLLVVEGSAQEFLEKLDAQNSPNLAKLLYSLLENYSQLGIIAMTNYTLFMEAILDGRFDPVLTLCAVDKSAERQEEQGGGGGGSQAQEETAGTTGGAERKGGMASYAWGSALFSGTSMVGKLTGEQTKYLLIATGHLEDTYINFTYEGKALNIHMRQGQAPDMSLSLFPTPKASVQVYIDCNIAVDSGDDTVESWDTGLSEALSLYMQGEMQNLFSLCRSLGCDAMGFGQLAVKHFSSTAAWAAYNWREDYAALEVDFSVTLSLQDSYLRGKLE